MENEKFQEMVLEHLVSITQDQTELKAGLNELRAGVEELRAGQEELKSRLGKVELKYDKLESRVERIYEHTAKLAEDVTIINQKLDALSDDVKYLKYKEAQTEEDLFKVRSYLKITR